PGWSEPGVASVIGLHHFGDYGSFLPDLQRGEIVVIPDVASDLRTREKVAALQAMGIRALINVPLIEHEVLVAVLFVHDETARPWTETDVCFVRAVADRTQAAIARMLAEKQQRLLNQELSHRLKNTFAMIQAIAAQTLRKVTERDRVEEFEQRIYALSSAHDVLVQQSWAAADIRAVVASALKTFGQSERFETGGPEIELHSRATLSLSLILHELATNASKYGALSIETGTVSLHWQLEDGVDGVPGVVMTWIEQGGPPIREPDRKGFGTRLIGMGLVGTGGVTVRYDNSGLRVEMRAPITQISDPAKSGDRR
ncbi:MAG TPA: HWE histidine kinase domain-containing protein, partial [Kofleriaceae bacterium]